MRYCKAELLKLNSIVMFVVPKHVRTSWVIVTESIVLNCLEVKIKSTLTVADTNSNATSCINVINRPSNNCPKSIF